MNRLPSDWALVDAHAHLFTRSMPLHDKPRHKPNYDFTLEQYLETLDRHGVRYGVIAAASPWADYNDYTIACVKANPRLRGTVILRPDVEKYILDFMRADGIVGVRLPYIGLERLPDLESFEYRRLLRRIADQGWHVHLHCEGRRLPELLPPLLASGVRLVVDHLGRPGPEEGADSPGIRTLLDAMEGGNVWVKASCAYRIGPPADGVLRAMLAAGFAERLLWASDCPFVGHEGELSYQDTLDWLLERVPGEHERRLILSSNALTFYGFSDAY